MKLTDGTLVSTALRDTLWQRTDTLLSFRKAVLVFNPVSYLRHRKIDILKLSVDSADVYAFRDGTGRANWDILPSADTLASGTAADTTADTVRTVSEISVRHVALRHGSVTFDDRETKVFANIRDAGLRLRARLGEGHSMLALDFRNRNILFWQDGELLVNRVATRLRASVELDRAQRTLTLHDALLGINGTEPGPDGNRAARHGGGRGAASRPALRVARSLAGDRAAHDPGERAEARGRSPPTARCASAVR